MKKIFTLASFACAAMAMNAQSVFTVSPMTDEESNEVAPLGERMSANGTYVAGMDQGSNMPFVWNVKTGELKTIVINDTFKEAVWDETYENIIGWEDVEYARMGSFHAVSDNGIAVGGTSEQGGNYTCHPCYYNMTTGEYKEFAMDEALDWEGNPMALGAEIYGVTADASTFAGFHFLDGWNVAGCIWDAEGHRTDLVAPSTEELGFEIDYASARGITPDGSVIWGYVQDYNTGAWVACHWTRNAEGGYDAHSFAGKFYQTSMYDEETGDPIEVENPNPWYNFEPVALSENGEWMTVIMTKEVALGPWAQACNYTGRLNLKSGELEVLDMGQDINGDISAPELFGVANDGTCVGRLTYDFIDWENEIFEQSVDAVIWKAGEATCQKLADLFPEDEYVSEWTASAISYISADGKTVMGYASDAIGGQTTFAVTLPDGAGINSVLAPSASGAAYDLQGRRVSNATKGLYINNGVKVLK